jgi:uncharacterized protein YecE (DUF72 family)
VVPTAPWGYLRLRRTEYDDTSLATWVDRLRELSARWSDTFVYFKHEDAGKGPALAVRLTELLAER